MNLNLVFLLAISLYFHSTTSAQIKIAPCPLDSVYFEKPHQMKMWLRDSIFAKDLENRINYLSALHRNYLPLHKALKKLVAENLNNFEKDALQSIADLYQTELLKKRAFFLGESLDFNQNLPIFAHLNWVIVFETLSFYPDVNAILANPKPMALTDSEIRKKVELIFSSTNSRFKANVDPEFHLFLDGIKSLQETEHTSMPFYGSLTPENREKYDWINFLIWCNRKY